MWGLWLLLLSGFVWWSVGLLVSCVCLSCVDLLKRLWVGYVCLAFELLWRLRVVNYVDLLCGMYVDYFV